MRHSGTEHSEASSALLGSSSSLFPRGICDGFRGLLEGEAPPGTPGPHPPSLRETSL